MNGETFNGNYQQHLDAVQRAMEAQAIGGWTVVICVFVGAVCVFFAAASHRWGYE